ncbi:df59c301-fe6e-4dd9-8696-2279a36334f1 [Sclerotinia trifoliorum]|uniref:Df59c301-fe6e-4dd9-8696-2279a36334f1 n=1 Tax=Sclerotinia trifoliorum TaxID=28548 RepID=A0A8H2VM71_9HELO|nr:df59c301-fe6e-4dd9-8696-2279a36334f1 [Sclerotinia trifoliorum]
MNLLVRKKSSSSFHSKPSEFGYSAAISFTTPSDQKPRELKSASYLRSSYETLLSTKGSFMDQSDLGITNTSKTLCRTLLESEQAIPENTLFRDDLFEETCRSIQARNEPMLVRDIAPLLSPSAQVLRIYGAKHLKVLNKSVNEGWNRTIPFAGPRPQPDYSVGFGRSAFTEDQLRKLEPFVAGVMDSCTSYFMGTWRMYFPFFTSEAKCGTAALDIADRQNAHSMTIAVRAIVELFRFVKRGKELHQEILAFSMSHDHRGVRIYGHYPVIDDKKITFHRHMIRTFDFTELDGKEKWTAYNLQGMSTISGCRPIWKEFVPLSMTYPI